MHPNCRCSTAAWMDRAETMKQIKAMSQVKSTEEYSDKKKIENIRSKVDITKEWTKKRSENGSVNHARSVSIDGKTYYVDGKNVVLDTSKDEINIAEILCKKYGYNITCLPRINNPKNIQVADYLIDGVKFDLKQPTGSGKNVLYGMIHKKRKQANNFIFDISKTPLPNEEIERQITSIYSSDRTMFVDKIILFKDNEIQKVYQRNK